MSVKLNSAQKQFLRELRGRREWQGILKALEEDRRNMIPSWQEAQKREESTVEYYAYKSGRLDERKNLLHILMQQSGD